MTEPTYSDLLDLATPFALDAVSSVEEEEIDRLLASAPQDLADAFAREVRTVQETMAAVSAASAAEPPAHLRANLLAAVRDDPVRTLRPRPEPRRPSRWQRTALAAAAVVVVGGAALGVGLALRPDTQPTTAEQVFAAPDVQTVSSSIAGGTATVVFSKERNAGVLVMNDVPPPQPGTVYQMWLVGADGPQSAGTMDDKAVSPSTTAVLQRIDSSQQLAFTVEPPGGSARPTSPIIASLPLA
ncbi:anti-sigma factor [Mycolicibacterium sp. S2-37]|uniref:anti-sigma factor n=1 Tax=Mycolicibacterium sp. S2-37 TaxID=2810297 RepID=UPI001A946C2A|nr:anti-sigma factor [Mycolicibacterium sp. S2-37]MBO0680328.1 anti-sigma factor [Mycolicibacterium sp. S2-37]